MRKITGSVLLIALSSSFAMAQQTPTENGDKDTQIGTVLITGALGIKKTADAVTSSQKVVSARELTQAAAPNAVAALAGKVTGLQIKQTNTAVDGAYSIKLRSVTSLTGDNSALIVIDNVISNATVLQNLSPELIESTNVIKGAQGAALYGPQGASGVIIVTTKRGSRAEKLTVTLNTSLEATDPYKFPYVQTRYGKGTQDNSYSDVDYGGTNYVAWENTSWGPSYSDPRIGGQMVDSGLPQDNNGTYIREVFAPVKNHFKKFFKTGFMAQTGVTATVGGADSYASGSFNRLDNNFVVEEDKQARNNFLVKAGKRFDKFRIDAQIAYTNTVTSKTDSNLYDDLIQMPTTNNINLYRNSGVEGYLTAYALNPYYRIQHNRYNLKRDYINAIVGLEYKFNEHINLTYNGNVSWTINNNDSHNDGYKSSRVYENTGTAIDGSTLADFSSPEFNSYFFSRKYNTRNYYGDLMLNFNYDLSDDWNFKLNLGNNIQENSFNATSVGGEGLNVPGIYNVNNISNLTASNSVLATADGDYMDNYRTRWRQVAGFANLDLAFKDYLFFNGTLRVEQASVMSTYIAGQTLTNKAYPYYSVGLSWIPTKMFGVSRDAFLSYVKIAPSYTRVGKTNAIGAYETDQIVKLGTGYPFGSLPGYILNRTPTSESIKPEYLNTMEVDLTLGFLRDRILFDGSYYQTKTTDLITFANASAASGLTRLKDNVGNLRARGMELNLSVYPFRTSNYSWLLTAGYTNPQTKIIALAPGLDEVALLTYSSPSVGIYAVKDKDFAMIKGSTYVRNSAGQIVVDSSGKPLINSTLSELGKTTPDFIMNFGTTLKVKNWTLAAVAQWNKGGNFVSFTKSLLAFTGGLEETADFDRTKGYVIPNSVQLVNGAYVANTTTFGGTANYASASNFFAGSSYRSVGENLIVNATFFKIREISLTYDFNRNLFNGTALTGASIGVYARNPIAIYAKNNRNYADPETSSTSGNAQGIALTGQYPTVRSFGMNIKLTF